MTSQNAAVWDEDLCISPCYEKVEFPSVISSFVYLNRQVKISISILRVSVSGWAQGVPGCWPLMIPDIFPIESQHRVMLLFFSMFGLILSTLTIASSKYFTALLVDDGYCSKMLCDLHSHSVLTRPLCCYNPYMADKERLYIQMNCKEIWTQMLGVCSLRTSILM